MAEIAELDHMPSRLPVAVWQAFPFPYAMSIAGSMAHPAIKNLFDLWGSVDGESTFSRSIPAISLFQPTSRMGMVTGVLCP